MIITRTPLRITLGGGGTDLPSYYSKHGGFVMSAAIDKYVYIALHRTFQRNYLIKYSQTEQVDEIGKIQHPIVREAFRLLQVEPQIEMVSLADIPAGSGLGSSGSFNVGLLKGLHHLQRRPVTAQELAESACRIEIELLREPVGKQDQYVAAYGGIICLDIATDGEVTITRLAMPPEAVNALEDSLLIFFTGFSRSASSVLEDQRARSEACDAAMIENLHRVKDLGYETKAALEAGDTRRFGELMHRHWENKRARSAGISNARIDRWYQVGTENGAVGGKLIGAGGGGFLLFYAADPALLRRAMEKEGLPEVRFSFDFEGSRIMTG